MTFPLKGADGMFRPFLTRVVPIRDEADRSSAGSGPMSTSPSSARPRSGWSSASPSARPSATCSPPSSRPPTPSSRSPISTTAGSRSTRPPRTSSSASSACGPKVGDSMLDLLADQPEHQAAVKAVWTRALAGEEFTIVEEFGDPGPRPALLRDQVQHPAGANAASAIGAYQIVYDVTRAAAQSRRRSPRRRSSCARRRRWRRWASSPAASPTTSTTCSPASSARSTSCRPASRRAARTTSSATPRRP